MTDSSLIAKKMADFRLILCAAPEFIKNYGEPASPHDLGDAPCIVDTNMMRRANWCFLDDDGEEFSVPVRGAIEVNSPEVARRAALAGLGMTMAPEFSVEKELESGQLVSLLEDRIPSGGGIYAVYPHRRHVPGKVRVFVDFLSEWFKKKGKMADSKH
ncbi:MAG: substrate binding domain-containing protein [Pseudomonadota bacterium]